MPNNSLGLKAVSLIWPIAFLAAGGAALLWLRLAQDSVEVLLAATVLALTVFLGTVWLSRDRAARRWNAALEAYAEREIARPGRGLVPRAAL